MNFECWRAGPSFHFDVKWTGRSRGQQQAHGNETGGKTAGKVITPSGQNSPDPQGAKNLSTLYTPNNNKKEKKKKN
jgi:hypothetical protein